METAHRIDTIVFDKTGTITEGKPKVTDIVASEIITENELLVTASAEKGSEHPWVRRLSKRLKKKGDLSSLLILKLFQVMH